MKRELAELIHNACQCAGMESSIDEGYSGRCMYGKTTCGVIFEGSMADLVAAVISNSEEFEDVSAGSFSQDSMGLGTVIY